MRLTCCLCFEVSTNAKSFQVPCDDLQFPWVPVRTCSFSPQIRLDLYEVHRVGYDGHSMSSLFCGEPIISLREKGAIFLQNDISVHTQNVWSVRAGLECRDHMISCIYGTHHTRKRLIHLIDVVSTSLSAINRWDMKYLFGGISWHSGGFPGGPNGKESTSQCRRRKRHGFDPRVWKMPWKRKWQPTPVHLPGKFYGQRSLVGYIPWGPKESDTTEHTHTQHPKPYL